MRALLLLSSGIVAFTYLPKLFVRLSINNKPIDDVTEFKDDYVLNAHAFFAFLLHLWPEVARNSNSFIQPAAISRYITGGMLMSFLLRTPTF